MEVSCLDSEIAMGRTVGGFEGLLVGGPYDMA